MKKLATVSAVVLGLIALAIGEAAVVWVVWAITWAAVSSVSVG